MTPFGRIVVAKKWKLGKSGMISGISVHVGYFLCWVKHAMDGNFYVIFRDDHKLYFIRSEFVVASL